MNKPRYYIRTRYHVWSIIDRTDRTVVEHIGARGRGDEAARELARETCARLNAEDR